MALHFWCAARVVLVSPPFEVLPQLVAKRAQRERHTRNVGRNPRQTMSTPRLRGMQRLLHSTVGYAPMIATEYQGPFPPLLKPSSSIRLAKYWPICDHWQKMPSI